MAGALRRMIHLGTVTPGIPEFLFMGLGTGASAETEPNPRGVYAVRRYETRYPVKRTETRVAVKRTQRRTKP